MFYSIIMPVYNGGKYLEKALESVCAQSFADWECLVIDDCSTDDTASILNGFCAKDSRIHVYRQETNKGVSAARNKGIQCAVGEYIWFMDADDTIESDMLEIIYKKLANHPSRLTVFGLVEEYLDADGRELYCKKRIPCNLYCNSKAAVRKQILELEKNTLYGYPWNKMYETNYLKKLGLMFEDYNSAKFIEDILFNINYCMDIDSLLLIGIAPYHYAKRANQSLTNEYVQDYYKFHRKRILKLWEQHKYWNNDSLDTREVLGALFARYILSALMRNYDKKAKMTLGKRCDFCRKIFNDDLFDELVPYGKSDDSTALKIAIRILNSKNILLCVVFSWIVYIIKNKLPVFYNRIKSQR